MELRVPRRGSNSVIPNRFSCELVRLVKLTPKLVVRVSARAERVEAERIRTRKRIG